jgi:hypothetical protein
MFLKESLMKKMSKRILTLIQIALFIASFPCAARGESAKQAVMALKKLEAKTQVGVSRRDYSAALGDAQFEVNQFIESRESDKNPELTRLVKATMADYRFVALLMEPELREGLSDYQYDRPDQRDEAEKKLFLSLLEAYPELEAAGVVEHRPAGQFTVGNHTRYFSAYRRVTVNEAMRVILQTASERLKKIDALMVEKKPSTKTKKP